MQDAEDAGGSSVANHRAGVVFRISGVDHHRLLHLISERDLSREGGALCFAGRIVVVIVEPAFSDRDRRAREELAQLRHVARSIKRGSIVWMDAGGRKNESGICRRELGRDGRGPERLSDADDRQRARGAGAGDYRVAVAAEGRVREVGVAVDED